MVPKCCRYVRQRWMVSGLACIGLAIAHLQRSCINVVLATYDGQNITIPVDCPEFRTKNPDIQFVSDRSLTAQRNILAAFFLGYFVSQIPGGILSVLYGAKITLGGSLLVSSLCSLLTPVARRSDMNYLLLLRFFMGLAQGPIDSALAVMGVKWYPREERCFLKSAVYSGVALGVLVGNLFPGIVLHQGRGVDCIFYTGGGLGAVWTLSWQLLFQRIPMDSPFITPRENLYIARSVAYDCSGRSGASTGLAYLTATGHMRIKSIRDIPWKSIFTSMQIVIVALANFGYDFGFQMLSTMLPFYVSTEFQLPVLKLGIMTAAPFFCMIFGTIMYGSLCQLLILQRIFKAETLTRTMGIISCAVSGLCLLVASEVRCAAVLAAILFSLSGFYGGASSSGLRLTPSLVAPALAGITNAASTALAGLPVLILSRTFSTDGHMEEWTALFYSTTAIMCLSSLPYILFTRTHIQPWNNI